MPIAPSQPWRVVVVAEPGAEALGHLVERAHRLREAVEHPHPERDVIGRREHGDGFGRQREQLGRDRRVDVDDPSCRLVVAPTRAPTARASPAAAASSAVVPAGRSSASAVYEPEPVAEVDHPGGDGTAELGEHPEREHLEPVGIDVGAGQRRCRSCAITVIVSGCAARRARCSRSLSLVRLNVKPSCELERFEPADRGVADHEALPLPRRRRESEQVGDRHRVGAGVGDEGDPRDRARRSARSADRAIDRAMPRASKNSSAPVRIRSVNSRIDSPPSSPSQRVLGGSTLAAPRRPPAAFSCGVPCHDGSRISSSHGAICSSRPSAANSGAAVWRARSSGET